MDVIKRTGKVVPFDKTKISKAILKTFVSLYGEYDQKAKICAQRIANEIEALDRDLTVEEIQNLVEDKLMNSSYKDVARSYINYRYLHTLIRESNTTDKSIKELIDGTNTYWKDENSNKNPKVVTTQRDYLAGITSTDITTRLLLPQDVVKADEEGLIHFHDKDYFAQLSLHNCFSGDTKFVTDLGVKRFDDFYDGDTVKVKDKSGIWRQATVRNYGKQKLYDVVFSAARTKVKVTCTANHRWILSDGTVTTNLTVGDKLIALQDTVTTYEPNSLEELRAFCYGFVLGDGCDYSKNSTGVQVRLCGNKNKYLQYFIDAGYSFYKIKDETDYVVYNKTAYSKQVFLDSQAWKVMSLEQKIALFHGYYAADGRTKSHSISTIDNRLMQLIEDISALAGYYIVNKFTELRDTNYKKDSLLTTYSFITKQNSNRLWKVESIVPHGKFYFDKRWNKTYYQVCSSPLNVWCVEEPVTHTFTLASGIVTGNCELINLNDMLQNGTVINGVRIDKPHRLITAATIATQIITAVTSSSYGGATVTLSHLAPFVVDSFNIYKQKYIKRGFSEEDSIKWAKEDTRKEIIDAVQTFNYQINSMTNTNGQAPFLSVAMYLNEDPKFIKETAMLIEEFLNQRILGFKNKQGVYITPAFPKLLYFLDENNITEDSEYWYLTELAAKCTAKRMVPDYISAKIMKLNKIDKNGNGNVYPCMGCRSFLTPYVDPKTNEPKYYGRFNQGVVTINLPDIALSSEGDIDKFWQIFDERTELCHKALQCRHERLALATSDVAPILWQHGALARLKEGESIHKLLHNGYSTLSLGYAGLYECVKYMTGESHTQGKGKEFGMQVMQALNAKTAEWKQAEQIDYSLYGSPIESTTYKFATCLKKRFGEIPEITDHNYVTNSYHVNVREHIDPFDKLNIESEYQNLSPGGAISYIECADLTHNIPAALEVIKYIYDHIMYAELNTKSDYCQVCGYDGEIEIIDGDDGRLGWRCPNCGNKDQTKMNVARRTCGYIGSQFWNQGRTQEIRDRYVHLDNHDEGV